MFSSSLAVETILVSSTWSGSANTQRLRPMRDSSTESTHGSRKGGRRITIEAMNRALHAIGWTHKKRAHRGIEWVNSGNFRAPEAWR